MSSKHKCPCIGSLDMGRLLDHKPRNFEVQSKSKLPKVLSQNLREFLTQFSKHKSPTVPTHSQVFLSSETKSAIANMNSLRIIINNYQGKVIFAYFERQFCEKIIFIHRKSGGREKLAFAYMIKRKSTQLFGD